MKIMLYAETRSYLTTLKPIDYLFPIIIDTCDLGPAHSSEAFLTAEHSLLASWRIDDDQYHFAGMVSFVLVSDDSSREFRTHVFL